MEVGESLAAAWGTAGATAVGLACGSQLRGLFSVKDRVKPGAAAVMAELHRQGLSTYLLTGDNPRTAVSIAEQTGILFENVVGGIQPEEKAGFIKQLQEGGRKVAFVGDGINDAPALAQADLGIAVNLATDIARDAADIVLLRAELEAVPEALSLARATLRVIRQNLFWAFFYNALGVPLAALGFLSPVLCAAAMGFSDLILVVNSLRLLAGTSHVADRPVARAALDKLNPPPHPAPHGNGK
jgi:P-type E1-E2 ATPase